MTPGRFRQQAMPSLSNLEALKGSANCSTLTKRQRKSPWPQLALLLILANALLLWTTAGAAVSPAALNIVLVGFHRPDRGWVSDYDVERILPDVPARIKAISLGPGPANRLRALVKAKEPDVPARAMANELESLAGELGLIHKGFTLFVLNLERTGGEGGVYGYCQSSSSTGDSRAEKDEGGNGDADIDDDDEGGLAMSRFFALGEAWGSRPNSADSTIETRCLENDTCRVD